MRKNAIKPKIYTRTNAIGSFKKRYGIASAFDIKKLYRNVLFCLLFIITLYTIMPFDDVYKKLLNSYNALVQDYFAVKNINLHGNVQLSDKQILELINLQGFNQKGVVYSIFDISPNIFRNLLIEYSIIKDASVRVVWPDSINIEIKERKPEAIWWHQDKFFLIDSEGMILREYNENSFSDYIIVIGNEANKVFFEILKMIENTNLKGQISSLQFIGLRRWNILLKNGIIIKLPENNIGMIVGLLDDKLNDYITRQGDVKSIDLRLAPERIFFKFDKSNATK